MLLTDAHIDDLLHQRVISSEWPWVTNDERVIDKHFKDILAEIRRKVRVEDKTEFGHYGSGYASYVDCWLYRPVDDFRAGGGSNYFGLFVLFSRLSHYYVMGQGQKAWSGRTCSSYLPAFELVDAINNPGVLELEMLVEPLLESRGLRRLRSNDLSEFLPEDVKVPTILTRRAYRQFDALFYWED